jgi:hypothetical protein
MRPFRELLRVGAPLLLVIAALVLASAPSRAEAEEGSSESTASESGEDMSVYEEEAPVQGRQRASCFSFFMGFASSFYAGSATLPFDGSWKGAIAEYEAEGEWNLDLYRGGLRVDVGKKTVKFKLGLFGQRTMAEFTSDGSTLIDYKDGALTDETDQTVVENFTLLGGGLELGVNIFIAFKLAKSETSGVPQFVFGPTIGMAINLSGGFDREVNFGGGFAALDVCVGLKFRLFNIMVIYGEVGGFGGAFIAGGGDFDMTVGSGCLWKAQAGLGVAF